MAVKLSDVNLSAKRARGPIKADGWVLLPTHFGYRVTRVRDGIFTPET